MPSATASATDTLSRATRWQRGKAATGRAFHAYARWLVGIGWRRFCVYAVLLLVATALLEDLPPFSWPVSEHVERVASPTAASKAARKRVVVTIDTDADHSAAMPPAASAAAVAPSEVRIVLPPGEHGEAVTQAVAEARQAIAEALAEGPAAEATEATDATNSAANNADSPRTRVVRTTLGEMLSQLARLAILASVVVKISYRGRLQAEVRAAQATETAEAESLKRQVLEARLAAMQAQVEPHFLFNTLASIEHLIQTDPPRASVMQKNLIALLRERLPGLRGAHPGGVRELGAELAVITPYLDILKVRMEERLRTVIDVPAGLRSAEFPPMVLQGLVENAIKHGLEPKAEGGLLTVHAEVMHGQLVVSVADTGLGFGHAATAGTGMGLSNIRERLQLLYGARAALSVAANAPSGTVATVAVPYVARVAAADPNATGCAAT